MTQKTPKNPKPKVWETSPQVRVMVPHFLCFGFFGFGKSPRSGSQCPIFVFFCFWRFFLLFFLTFGVGLLDVKLNSSPRPVYSLPGVPNPRDSLECPTPKTLNCPTPETLPRVPTPDTPWSAQPQRIVGVPNPRAPQRPWSAKAKCFFFFFFGGGFGFDKSPMSGSQCPNIYL